MSIREKVIDNIYSSDICEEYELKSHLYGNLKLCLIVYPDGDLVLEEVIGEYYGHGEVLEHTSGVGCNCEWCAEWEQANNAVENGEASQEQAALIEEYPSEADFVKDCIYNNDVIGTLQAECVEKVKEIREGFFDDEEQPIYNKDMF